MANARAASSTLEAGLPRRAGASFYRLNFDLHRASGLWLFALLSMFAWSSVCFNLDAVYRSAIGAVFDFDTPLWKRPAPAPDATRRARFHAAREIPAGQSARRSQSRIGA